MLHLLQQPPEQIVRERSLYAERERERVRVRESQRERQGGREGERERDLCRGPRLMAAEAADNKIELGCAPH